MEFSLNFELERMEKNSFLYFLIKVFYLSQIIFVLVNGICR
jgi:hypothetical protein